MPAETSWLSNGTMIAAKIMYESLKGENVQPSWLYHGTIMALPWGHHGRIMAISWDHDGCQDYQMPVQPSWLNHGTMMAAKITY